MAANANKEKKALISLPNVTSNQPYFRINYMKEFVKKQGEINNHVTNTMNDVHHLIDETRNEQTAHFDDIYKQMEEQKAITSPLLKEMEKQQLTSKEMIDQLYELKQQNKQLLEKLENEKQVNETMIDKLTAHDQSLNKFAHQIKESEQLQQLLKAELDEQMTFNESMKEKLVMHEAFHENVIERIHAQNEETEKVANNVENLKVIIFEKISNVVEKIEDNYKLTKDVMLSLFSRSNEQQEEKEKEHINH